MHFILLDEISKSLYCENLPGINSHVRYGLTQAGEKVFDIDPDSGIISLVADLDREQNPHYDLTVTAYNVVCLFST